MPDTKYLVGAAIGAALVIAIMRLAPAGLAAPLKRAAGVV